MIEAFISVVRENRVPPVTWEDGYEALKVALAAYESGRLQRPVRVGKRAIVDFCGLDSAQSGAFTEHV